MEIQRKVYNLKRDYYYKYDRPPVYLYLGINEIIELKNSPGILHYVSDKFSHIFEMEIIEVAKQSFIRVGE